jgi:hypothetical protein
MKIDDFRLTMPADPALWAACGSLSRSARLLVFGLRSGLEIERPHRASSRSKIKNQHLLIVNQLGAQNLTHLQRLSDFKASGDMQGCPHKISKPALLRRLLPNISKNRDGGVSYSIAGPLRVSNPARGSARKYFLPRQSSVSDSLRI